MTVRPAVPSPAPARIRRAGALGVALMAAATLVACGSADDDGAEDTAAQGDHACDFADVGGAARPVSLPPETVPSTGEVRLDLRTGVGDIPVVLDREAAPCAVASTVHLAESAFYVTTACHRLTTAESGMFFLQCGDPSGRGSGGPGYAVPSEPARGLAPAEEQSGAGGDSADGDTDGDEEVTEEVVFPRGSVVLADRRVPDSGGSQFLLIYADTVLPADQTLMGTVTEDGLEVLDEIAKAGSDDAFGAGDGRPETGVRLRAVDVTKD